MTSFPSHRLQISVLASGSKGNSIYISNEETAILIDAGLSKSELLLRLAKRSLSPQKIQAIILSHEHTDHVRGAYSFSRQFRIPVYATAKTMAQVKEKISGNPHSYYSFTPEEAFWVDQLEIRPFSISHDAQDPSGFTITFDGIKIGIATDLGTVTSAVRSHLKNCHLLVLEANHDMEMLLKGPYPWFLKERIQSEYGHLSNVDTQALLHELLHTELKHVILAHVSEKNNCVHLLKSFFTPFFAITSTTFSIASQTEGTPLFSI